MTNEQAIAELQKEHDLIAGEYDLDGSQFAPALLEALAMAIEALKARDMTLYMNLPEVSAEEVVEILKRNTQIQLLPSAQPERDIPVKPNETTDKAWGIPKRQAVCPKCDYYLGHVAFLGDYKGKRITYCEVCGQAIDGEPPEFEKLLSAQPSNGACWGCQCEKMEKLQPEREKGKWIPCSEQLPEDSNFYIVTRKDFLVGFIWYSVFHGWEWDEQSNIIAWMPLPEEYRGEQDEQSKTQICCTNCN